MKKVQQILINTNPYKNKFMKDFFVEIGQTTYKLLVGIVTAMFGYFLPIKDFVHLLIILLVIDMIFGYWANNKIKGEKFSMQKVWGVTVPRMVVGIVLIISAFMWDTTYKQESFQTYIIVGWLLSGFTFGSIVQNGYKITQWKALTEIGTVLLERLPIVKNKKDKNEV